MVDIEKLIKLEQKLRVSHPGYGPTLRSEKAVVMAGITNPSDVKRLGRRIRDELLARNKKDGPALPPIPFA